MTAERPDETGTRARSGSRDHHRLDPSGLERLRHEEFPLTAECIYLNHAASSPLPQRSVRALRDYAGLRAQRHRAYQTGTVDYDLAPPQNALAGLLNCDAAEIGFVPSTCDGISIAANGIDWRPGDNVVVPQCDFPGVIYPWVNLKSRGVEVRFCPTPGGHIDIGALLSRVTSTTRAIALSHVQWTNGFKVDLEPLGRFCREQGILSIVDAIQSLGVQPIDVRSAPIDVLVSGCFKWLLGIPGMALLYVSREALARFHPDRAGTESVVSHDSLDLDWRGDSLRFLVGSLNEPALCVLAPSVELLQELGIPQIQAHTAALVDRIDTGLQNLGLSITSSPLPEHRSSILSFTTGSREQDDRLVRRLLDRNVITGLRPSGVRVAPHFYNTVSDVDALLDAVKCSIR